MLWLLHQFSYTYSWEHFYIVTFHKYSSVYLFPQTKNSRYMTFQPISTKKKNRRRILLKNVLKILSKMWKNSIKNMGNTFSFFFIICLLEIWIFFWHFTEVHAIYNAHTCSRSVSRINLNHDTTSLVKLTTRINPSLTLMLDYFNWRLTLIWWNRP